MTSTDPNALTVATPAPTDHGLSIPGATPFDGALLDTLGLRRERGLWRIPGTGWRIYDATAARRGDPFVWGYDHDEDGKEYGEVHSLSHALAGILWAEEEGLGDNKGYAQITVPTIKRLIAELSARQGEQ